MAVNNLSTLDPTAGWIERIFPHIGQGNRVDTASIAAAWDIVRREYVFRDVKAPDGTFAAERGIIQYLRDTGAFNDRFSAFFTAEEYQSLERDLSGQRNGSIGVALEARCGGAAICPSGQKGTVVAIEDVLRDQPAEKAGLRNGDILVRAAGHDVSTLASDILERVKKAAQLVRGNAGTSVSLTVLRGTHTMDVTVTRANLHIPSVYSQRIGSVLYMQVTGFEIGTGDDLKAALSKGLSGGASGIVLDLRHNNGGFVDDAQSVASEFLLPRSSGVSDIVVRRGRLAPNADPGSAQQVDHDPIKAGAIAVSQPLAVLVDQDSASAAEIVAAALHDYHRATLVGQKTFGKGSVQADFSLPDGSDLHLTIQKWYGPSGESIDGTGITPDKMVTIPDDDHRYRLDSEGPPPSIDGQLQVALAAAQGR